MRGFLFVSLLLLVSSLRAEIVSYGIVGDAGRWNSGTKQVHGSLIRNQVTNLILPGDNIYSVKLGYAKTWKEWGGFNFDYVALGNHKISYSEEVAFFGIPGEYYSGSFNGHARFIVLNSDNPKTVALQMTFLETELSSATEPQIYLVYHHPTYSISRLHTWQERRAFQTAIRPLLQKYRSKITALIVGHDHLASLLHFDDLPVILSGAVQEVRNDGPVRNVQSGVKVETAWYFDSTPHWVRLDIDTDKPEAVVRFIRGKDDLEGCTAILVTGSAAKLAGNCKSPF